MLKRAPQSFRLAALAALVGTAVGLVALCPGQSRAEGYLATQPIEGTYELYAKGLKEIGTVVTINVK